MNKALPDKWARKAVYDAVDGMVVDTHTINVYDEFVTRGNIENPDHYILLSTQNNEEGDKNKCEDRYDHFLLIDCVTSYPTHGNTGSRLLVDNILDEVRNRVKDLTLDVASGLEIERVRMSFPSNITTKTDNENVFRKFLRLELQIK